MLPAHTWFLILASHTLLLTGTILGIITIITEWQEHQERKTAKALTDALRRHPARKNHQ